MDLATSSNHEVDVLFRQAKVATSLALGDKAPPPPPRPSLCSQGQ